MTAEASTAHPPTTSGRIVAYDGLRVFAILSVVAIHTLMPYRSVLPADAPVRIFDDVLHYAVPLFVFISGALLWSRPWPTHAGAFRRFLLRRGRTIAAPYALWAIAYAGIYVFEASDRASALHTLPALLLNGHVWYHLYFIPMLLTFYLLTPVAAMVVRRSPETLLIACYAIRLLAGPAIAELARDLLGQAGWQYATHIVIHLPHMALGAWFAMRRETLPRAVLQAWPLALLGGLGGLVIASLGWTDTLPPLGQKVFFAASMALTVLGSTAVAFALPTSSARTSRAITHLGSLSFGVYFTHPLFLLGIGAMAGPADAGSAWWRPWFPVAVWATTSIASIGTAELLRRGRWSAWTVGLSAPSRP